MARATIDTRNVSEKAITAAARTLLRCYPALGGETETALVLTEVLVWRAVKEYVAEVSKR